MREGNFVQLPLAVDDPEGRYGGGVRGRWRSVPLRHELLGGRALHLADHDRLTYGRGVTDL